MGLVIRAWPWWSPEAFPSPITLHSSCCPHHLCCPLRVLQKRPWSPSDASLAQKCHPCPPVGGLMAGLAFKTCVNSSSGTGPRGAPPLPSLTPSSQALSGSVPCYLHSENRLYLTVAAKYSPTSVEYSWLGKWSWGWERHLVAPAVGLRAQGGKCGPS